MEGTEAQSKNEALKLQLAIRSVKATNVLSSLNRGLNDLQIKNEELEKEVVDLKVKLVKERLKNQMMKLCGLMELFLQLFSLLFIIFLLFIFASP